MSTQQIHENNFSTTVGVQLLVGGGTLTVNSGDGAGFREVLSQQFALLTLVRASDQMIEIVKVTAHDPGGGSPDDFTITRAQEGTSALQFEIGDTVECRATAGLLDKILDLDPLPSPPTDSAQDALTIQPAPGPRTATDHVAHASGAIAIGKDTEAGGGGSIAIGDSARLATSTRGIRIGVGGSGEGTDRIAIGRAIAGNGERCIIIGENSSVSNSVTTDDVIIIGNNAAVGFLATADDTVVIGNGAGSFGGTRNVAIGHSAGIPNGGEGFIHLVGQRFAWNTTYAGTQDRAGFGTSEEVILTADVNLLVAGNFTADLPTGWSMYVNECGLIITAATSVTVQPFVLFGDGAGDNSLLAATQTTGLTAAQDRQRFTSLLSDAGINTPSARVETIATATTLMGRFYWQGFIVMNG